MGDSNVGGIQGDRLKSFVERLERLAEERASLVQDFNDVLAEAAGSGFDKKTLRKLLALRKLDKADAEEQETLLDLYKRALGMA